MSIIPMSGYLVALEAWTNGRQLLVFAVVRTTIGSFNVWTGDKLDGRIVALAAAGPSSIVQLDDSGLAILGQTWTRDDAARAYAARSLKAAVGGIDGWHPAYAGGLTLPQLGVNRFDAASRFREHAPASSAPVVQPADVSFDPNDFAARLRARRASVAATAQVEADLRAERDTGARRVKALGLTPGTMLADLPVCGLTANGPPIAGQIHSCNPNFAVVEAKLDDLARVSGPVTWVYDLAHPFTVGVTAADHQ